MSTLNHDESEREMRLNQVLLAYIEAVQEGRMPDRGQLLSGYPEFTAELTEFFALRDQFDRVAAPLRDVSLSGSSPRGRFESRGSAPAVFHHAGSKPEPRSADPSALELGQIGEFRLVREIGRGGMGVVYEAHQLSLNRRVALKVLPFVAALDPKHLQRFQNEAQTAAQLHHTNIVPVHAVGCERGVHYYAMQYIEGQSVASVIKELRELAGRGVAPVLRSERSSERETQAARAPATVPHLTATTLPSTSGPAFFRKAAQLGRKAAEALEHAHQLGVVHRDIKPANLLIDVRGDLWITDFGLALFQSGAGLTLTGELVGTLRYMSPEQAWAKRSQVDHRTDIYSLGATLYELLTLRPAFDADDRQELLQQITSEEPQALRRVDSAIPVELETIVLKAIAKVPAERYASAQELADDLQRFLEDKPIRARRPNLRERATKWVRRHRSVVGSAVALLLVLLVGSVVSTILVTGAYERESQKAKEAAEQRRYAEQSLREARRAVDELVQIGEEELAGNQDLEGLRWRLLDAALAYYQDFVNQHHENSVIQAGLETSRANVRTILDRLTTLVGSYQYIPLHMPEVQDELHLSVAQRNAIKRMQDNWMKKSLEVRQRSPGERERQRLELARDQEKRVAQLLTPEQLRRFKQIALQYIGPLAFSDPGVAEALRLTPEQKKEIRTSQDWTCLLRNTFSPRPDRRRSPQGANEATAPDQVAQVKILGLLTPEQRRQWDELVGEPFSNWPRPRPEFPQHHPAPRNAGDRKLEQREHSREKGP
jgi:serine/threonine protein kinase